MNEQPKQNPYKITYDLAADALRNRWQDPDALCERSGAVRAGNDLELPYFNTICTISFPEVIFSSSSFSLYEQILILHYLGSEGTGHSRGAYVSFKNLPSASFYNPTYRKRSIDRILSAFGDSPERLVPAGEALGGWQSNFGDVSVELDVFPRIRAIVMIHRGDEEFPPEAGMLFKDDIINYLPLEDIAVTAGFITGRLIEANKKRL